MLHSTLAQVTTAITAGVTGWAVLRGRAAERVAATAIALDWAGSILFQDHRLGHHGQPATFALDLAMTGVLLAIVLKSRRTWVLWAAACSVLLVLTHITLMIDTSFAQWTFLTASYVWSLGVVAALAGGMGLEREARRAPPHGRHAMAPHPSIPSARARRRN